MPKIEKEVMKDLLAKYRQRVEEELGSSEEKPQEKITTREYQQFKEEFLPRHFTLYEKLCNISEKILKIKPDKKKAEIIQESISVAHLNITPTGVSSFAILGPLVLALFGSLILFALTQSPFFIVFSLLVGVCLIFPMNKIPTYMADSWRMKASNQMVLCVFYVVTYMRHTSNMEKAVEFASDHLSPPLSLDLRKVIWDVETQKYDSLKYSLESYLATWKKYNLEFVEAFHLIESSLYEGEEPRRLAALEKSLDVILEETYEKMLHYAHNLKSPITMLHMLGVILPILGLVILPLIVSFMENVKWYHIATIYNITLPIAVYFMGKNILSRRPTGYGDTDISEENPELKKYRNILIKVGKSEIQVDPLWLSVTLGAILFVIGILPLLLHAAGVPDIPLTKETDKLSVCGKTQCFLGYEIDDEGGERGPFGLGSAILGFFVILSLGLGIGLYYKLRSKNVIKIRDRAKELEQEFASALFQLGNRIGDNIPAEMAVGKVADLMEGTTSGNFFQLVSQNIRKLGMSVKEAIFDPKHGALAFYPSSLIESSMKVLIESVKKGPQIAAQALMNVSRYIKEIHTVNERLRDLMSDIISSMNSQIKFLTPVISGIVIGITSMISAIIGKLGKQVDSLKQCATGASGIPDLFDFKVGIPPYYFQIIVGIYVIQIIYILTVLSNGIQNGSDKLSERFNLGVNMVRGTLLYAFIGLAVTILFSMIASTILNRS